MPVTMTPWRRLLMGALAAFILSVTGVIGYVLIEGFSLFDAVYQTLTTITTAGFGEVEPMDRAGRIFTLFLIVLGVIVILYVLSAVMQIAVEGELETMLGVRRTKQRIERLAGHYIVCGYGRVGEEIARDLEARGVPFVVIETNPDSIARGHRHRRLCMEGDATDDAVLRTAGIERARALLAASDSDSGNTFIVLTAKAIRPDLYVIARYGQAVSEPRMRRAGADRVVSPYSIAGRRIALAGLQPAVVDFIDLLASHEGGGRVLAEVMIGEDSFMCGLPVHEAFAAAPETIVLAVAREAGVMQVGVESTYVLSANDRLIVVSEEAALESLGGGGAHEG